MRKFTATVTKIEMTEYEPIAIAYLKNTDITMSFEYHSGYIPLKENNVLEINIFVNEKVEMDNQTFSMSGVVDKTDDQLVASFGGLIMKYSGDIEDIKENDKIYMSVKKI